MAHELTIANGRAEMAYLGDTPWHGLGQSLEAGASIETWTEAAGMNWTVENTPVLYSDPGCQQRGGLKKTRTMNDRVVLYRSDSGDALSVVSNRYQVVQPGEVLEFFRDLTQGAGFALETAGTLFGGRRLWALASIGEEAKIADPRDKVKGYLLLCTACDGSMSTEARYTTVRVVCNNTLGFARQDQASVRVSHRTTFDMASVRAELGIEAARVQFAKAMDDFRRLAAVSLTDEQVTRSTASLFVPGFGNMDREDQAKVLTRGPVHRVNELALNDLARGAELHGVSGTAWGWLNAVTEYVDHEARAKNQDTRVNSAWFGRGEGLKEQALGMALAMAD